MLVLFSGCAKTPHAVKQKAKPNRVVSHLRTLQAAKDNTPIVMSLESMLLQSSTDSKAGQSEKAVTLLKTATENYPADKRPWLQIAQINFDNSNYGVAIVNALEALQRDPVDKLANSIVAVSALRLSTGALADLRKQNELSGSVSSEARDLAELLRESLGELVLVPSQANDAAKPKKINFNEDLPPKTTYKKAAPIKATRTTEDPPRKAQENPFSSLEQ